METGSDYQAYVQAAQNLEPMQARTNRQQTYAEDFEAIYQKVLESDVKLDSAQEFLQNLSSEEMRTLQHYTGLADPVQVEGLSDEGAYNLLMHDYEKYDFTGDGVVEDGAAHTMVSPIGRMESDSMREAYIEAYNGLTDHEKLMSHIITIDTAHFSSSITGEAYEAEPITYESLKERIDSIINPKPPAETSEEMKSMAEVFWTAFDAAYDGEKTETAAEEEENAAIQKFWNDLRTKGAAGYIADLNMEKIEEKLEEYREKLIEAMGDSPENMKIIEELVAKYREQLMKELEEKEKQEKADSQSQASLAELLQIL